MVLDKTQNQKQGAATVALAFAGGRALVQQGVFAVLPGVVAGSVAENLGGWLVDGSFKNHRELCKKFLEAMNDWIPASPK